MIDTNVGGGVGGVVNDEEWEWLRSTTLRTALWPPEMHAALTKAVCGATRGEREKAVVRLLELYTTGMLSDAQRRWLRI